MAFLLGEKVLTRAKIEVWKGDRERKLKRRDIDEVEGIVVGARIMKEGHTEVDSDGMIFYPSKYVRVILVALSLNHTIRVLPEDLRKTK